MIIESVDFFNAGIFKGSHHLDLAPVAPGNRPVVLIGGKNGRGKTTLLDSIHFVLYGKGAQLANRRGDQNWEDFLKDFMNRQAPPSEGAAIGLSIRIHTEGKEHHLRAQREWKLAGSKVKETLTVWMDGKESPELAEDWSDYVEGLIPSQIAHLFLFDGEQIEALAAPEKSREILRTGIYGLLGADLLGRLEKDLQALNRKIRLASASAADVKSIELLEQQFLAARQLVDSAKQTLASTQRDIQSTAKVREEVLKRIQAQGGHLLNDKAVLEVEETALRGDIESLETEIRDMLGGTIPLVEVLDILREIEVHATLEQSQKGAREHLQQLEGRDQRMVQSFTSQNVPSKVLNHIKSWLTQDREHLATELEQGQEIYGFSPEGYAQLKHLVGGGLAEEKERHESLQAKLMMRKANLEAIQRRLSRIPDPEAIAHLLAERDAHDRRMIELKFTLEGSEKAKKASESQLVQLERTLQKETSKLKAQEVDQAKLNRQLTHLERARVTVISFKQTLVAKDIRRIETEILLSAQRLFAKQKLITGVSIDPGTFQLTIHDAHGASFSPLQLSAGERQILAISILWGLSKASGKTLPVFIDTPLGRLDHDHRDKLVSSYFPNASHQVVLLSTDEEITHDRYQRLSPWVSRVASLVYDETSESSRIEPGRFFDDIQHITPQPLFEEALQ